MKRCAVCGEKVLDSETWCPRCKARKFFPIRSRGEAYQFGVAENAKNFDEAKQKALSDLYAIRATMSLIAENDDTAELDRQEIRNIKNRIRDREQEIKDSKREEEEQLKEYSYETEIRAAKEKESDLLYEEKKHEEAIRDLGEMPSFFGSIAWYVYLIICLALSCTTINIGFSIVMSLDMPFWVAFILAPVFSFAAIVAVCAIVFVVRLLWYLPKMQAKKSHNAQLDRIRFSLKEVRSQIAQFQEQVDHGKIYLDVPVVQEWKSKTVGRIEACNRSIEQLNAQVPTHQTQIQSIAQRSQAITESAARAYTVIDIRDWANVDLLIYYFETGRADNMKEALQLVDRQRQTDQITQALAMASAEISRTIYQSVTQLGSALGQAFGMLSAQLTAQHGEMMSGLNEQAAQQREAIRRQTAEMANAQEMNRALLQKISTSSGHLAEQMDRQMREVHGIY